MVTNKLEALERKLYQAGLYLTTTRKGDYAAVVVDGSCDEQTSDNDSAVEAYLEGFIRSGEVVCRFCRDLGMPAYDELPDSDTDMDTECWV